MTDNSGKRANETGRHLENFVSSILSGQGYELVRPSKNFFAMTKLKQPIYAKQCLVGKNIYDRDRKVDLILFHPEKWPNFLVIECKWQASSGLTDEKYPFAVQCIEKSTYPTIIVLDGGGYSAGAKSWLYSQAGKGKLIEVMDQGGFQRFAKRGKI